MRAMGWLLLLMAAPTAEQRYFQYERPVTPNGNVAGQSCVALDGVVFAHAAPGLADLRLYRGGDSGGDKAPRNETPYVVRRVEEVAPAATVVTPLNLGMRDGRVVFDAAMPEGRYSDVELAVTHDASRGEGQDFLASVTVTGSNAESEAGTKLGEFTIFDLNGQRLGRSTMLHLPESDFRYLHFSVAGPIEARSFTGVSVQRGTTEKTRYVAVASSSEAVQKGTDTVFTLPVAKGVPVERLEIEPGLQPREFSRDVTVKTEVKGSGEINVTEPFAEGGRLLRVHRVVNGRKVDEEELAFSLRMGALPEAAAVTVTIHNGSDAPMAVKSVRLEMVERDLCFDVAAGGSYALYYGDAALEAPTYEYARLFAADGAALRVGMGAEVRNRGYVARPDGRPFTERHRWLLWAALVGAIGVLGMVAMRTAKTAPRD